MRSRHRRTNILWAVVIFALTACSGAGSCGGCDMEPLPEGGLPGSQTIEGAAQVRVTPAGFEKVSELVPPVVNELFADGICIPRAAGSFLGASYEACHENDCIDANDNPGCQIDIELNEAGVIAEDEHTLRLGVDFDGEADIPARYGVASCTFELEGEEVFLSADIEVDIDERTGDLRFGLAGIPDIDLDGLDIGGCSFVSGFASLIKDHVAERIVDFFSPYVDDFIQGLLPDPLGIEGVLDVTPLITQFRPQSEVKLELRAEPGGHAHLENDGLNLGLIAGINTDYEPEDRSFHGSTTPSPCVPPIERPDFAAEPYELARLNRGSFELPPAGEFAGENDPDGQDVVMGVSETALHLAGYHAFASGALCLGLDSSALPQLNLGTLGVLVPSLAELGTGTGDDPMLVVIRPQEPIDATVEDGSGDTNVTLHLRDLEIDLYAFLFERWVRAFTLGIDLDLGLGVELTVDDAGAPALLPTLAGLDAQSVSIQIRNPEFVREDPQGLEDVIPALLDLVVPHLSSGLGTFELPRIAGFTLTDLEVGRIETDEDAFLSIAGAFGEPEIIGDLAQSRPALAKLADEFGDEGAPERAETRAEIERVTAPAPAEMQALPSGAAQGGDRAEVVIDVDTHDASGRPLEHSWRIEGGIWRPFSDAAPLVLRDRAFAFQGHYEIEVKARAVGDYRTTDPTPVALPVIIDSVPPIIHPDRARAEGESLIVPATDAVSPSERIERALGPPGADAASTAFDTGALDLDDARDLADSQNQVEVFARDEAGNESSKTLDLDRVGVSARGCHAAAGGGGFGGGAAALLLVLVGLAGWRCRRALFRGGALCAAIVAIGFSSAGCGGSSESCASDGDCEEICEGAQNAMCIEGGCECDALSVGDIGQHSAVAVDALGNAWVSAYNETYGDLMVAEMESAGRVDRERWEFVDGVPDGPVVAEDSPIRDGIADSGPDVGLYTDIATGDDGAVYVSYLDRDQGALKLAVSQDGDWDTHVVDHGEGDGSAAGYELAGMYTALTLDPNGSPGIAYLAVRSEGETDVATEVRFAQATTHAPTSASAWDIHVADRVDLASAEENDDPFPIPDGVGLYLTADRYSDGRPVLAYYDRLQGALKSAEWSTASSGFSDPTVLDDGDGLDVGRYPSIAIDDSDELHVTYVSDTRSELLYWTSIRGEREVVDDGHRIREVDENGVPRFEFHFVGDDSSLVITDRGPVVTYQDATEHALLVAERTDDGEWERRTLAGNEEEFAGGYGFFASSALAGGSLTVSNWVIDQPSRDSWVELHRRQIADLDEPESP